MRRPSFALRLLPGIACVLVTACAPIERHFVRDDAISTFSSDTTCPTERLVVRQLAVAPESLFERPPPPPDIAADPGRRRVWDDETQLAYAGWDGLSAVDIAGCDARVTYLCWFEDRGDGTESPLCIDAARLAERTFTHHLQLRGDALAALRGRFDAAAQP
jgi:hypothetical protein